MSDVPLRRAGERHRDAIGRNRRIRFDARFVRDLLKRQGRRVGAALTPERAMRPAKNAAPTSADAGGDLAEADRRAATGAAAGGHRRDSFRSTSSCRTSACSANARSRADWKRSSGLLSRGSGESTGSIALARRRAAVAREVRRILAEDRRHRFRRGVRAGTRGGRSPVS